MPEADTRVSTLELFFDLVFVFTITQVALIVELHPWSFEAVAQAFVELLVIYWMYGGFAWLTNALGTSTTRQRIVLLAGMAAFFVVSLSVPRAFGADGVAFGIAYLVLTLVHLGGFLLRGTPSFAAMVRIGGTNVAAALLILAAGFTGGSVHWPLWGIAILMQVLPSLRPSRTASIVINVDHFAERHGLMIIIVLGESLVSVALAAQELPVDATLVFGALCGLAASAAMWWCYFTGDDAAATAAFERVSNTRRGFVGLVGYDGPHVLMIAGLIGVAAGTRLALPDLTASTSTATAGLIAGGAAAYLLGLAAFRAVLRFATPWGRLAFALVALATIPVGTGFGAATQLLTVAAVLVVLLFVEFRWLDQGANRGAALLRRPGRAG